MLAFAAFLVMVAVIYDLRSSRIPNWLTFSSAVTGLTHGYLAAGWSGLWLGAQGFAVGLGLMLAWYALGGMGAGDVKLMAAVGAWVGMDKVFGIFLFTALAGGLYALVVLLVYRRQAGAACRNILNPLLETVRFGGALGRMETCEGLPRLRYALPIAVGTLIALFR